MSQLFRRSKQIDSPQRCLSKSSHWNQEPRAAEVHFSQNISQTSSDPERPITNQLHFLEPSNVPRVPAYRVLSPNGQLLGQMDPTLDDEKILHLYKAMLKLNTMDKIMFDSHRQGRISFYMTNFGEEAAQFGSAAGIEPQDWVYAQYREAGVLVYRQMPLRLMLAQCYGNKEDLGKGRQMPIHYGNRELNFVTISSTLTTQLPQAAGSAFAFKQKQDNDRIVVCYFGEGAASEGDAHAAMNFAATLNCPVIFFCRNNGYAISTPTHDQYRGDGIVNRALGYGMSALRVDGNDLFAVYAATRKARQYCLKESRPILIEAMTYRLGHHSTSDDSSAYRSVDEIKRWETEESPMARVKKYLQINGLWDDDQEREVRSLARAEVIDALNWAEKTQKLPITSMFDDVYHQIPAHLERQREELIEHLNNYGEHYPINEYERL